MAYSMRPRYVKKSGRLYRRCQRRLSYLSGSWVIDAERGGTLGVVTYGTYTCTRVSELTLRTKDCSIRRASVGVLVRHLEQRYGQPSYLTPISGAPSRSQPAVRRQTVIAEAAWVTTGAADVIRQPVELLVARYSGWIFDCGSPRVDRRRVVDAGKLLDAACITQLSKSQIDSLKAFGRKRPDCC